jgi:hypothetical protein
MIETIKRHIEISFQKEGIHRYPAAETDPRLAAVSFLAHPHRHMFHFYVKLQVFHNDREVEFILFKRELENLYSQNILQLDYRSCEMMADDLIAYIKEKYPRRIIAVRVYEDNENGAILEYEGTDVDE